MLVAVVVSNAFRKSLNVEGFLHDNLRVAL